FMNYSWPGNVRELENTIERIVALKDEEEIKIDDIDEMILKHGVRENFIIPISGKGVDFLKVTQNTERELIISALKECEGSHTKAAKILNIKVRSLRYLIEKYKLNYQNL
ncbi:MAG: sigma-54-dependent Fis family transcriptional regulator, partial [Candidatus Omnitrophica bacterium]|nr:sigma-54-dependent Fis family transcriptional regulator [Candidatus Omnitrophota bacterium]